MFLFEYFIGLKNSKCGMSDVSKYTIEFRVLSSAWWFESDNLKMAMKSIRKKLKEKYSIDPPNGKYIKSWSEKLFQTGSVLDLPRSGRPEVSENRVEKIEEEIQEEAKTSVRRLSNETGIPKTSVHRILKETMLFKCWKSVRVQFLSEADHKSR